MARTSLGGVLVAMLTCSCLFPAPPSYREPEQTPPILWSPTPSPAQIQFVKSGERFDVNVKLKSEDNGEEIRAVLVLNYLDPSFTIYNLVNISPDTLSAENRVISIPLTIPERDPSGTCEQLFLIVAHESSLDGWRPIDDSDPDVQILTWWLAINGNDQTLLDCATRGGIVP